MNIEVRGTFSIYYHKGRIWFATEWNNGHSQQRTLTEEEADFLVKVLRGGYFTPPNTTGS